MRVLVRVYRDPFRSPGPEQALEQGQLGGKNNGNLLFTESAVRALAVDGTDLSCWTLERMIAEPEAVNERFDHVVLPFANSFRMRHEEQLRAATGFLRRLRIPVTVLGIGAQSTLDYGLTHLDAISDDVRDFVAAVLDRSPSLGVRGAHTAHLVRRLGFSDVEVIGCPSMFMHGPHLEAAELPAAFDRTTRVTLNLNRNRPLPAGWLDDLIDRHPELVYFGQTRSDLHLLLWGGRPGRTLPPMDDYPDRLEHPVLTRAAARMHVDPAAWVEDLRSADFTLGTRIHGNIAAVLAGRPAHVLAHDSRTRELAEYFEIPWTRLRDLTPGADLAALAAGHDYGAVARGHAGRFATYTDYLARHRLPHVWEPGARSTFADSRQGGPTPRPAEVRGGQPTDVLLRLGWLKQAHDDRLLELETRVQRQDARLQRQGLRLQRQNARLQRQDARLQRHGARLERQDARLKRLEEDLRRRVAAAAQPPPTPAARLRRLAGKLVRRVHRAGRPGPGTAAQAVGSTSPARSDDTSPVTPAR